MANASWPIKNFVKWYINAPKQRGDSWEVILKKSIVSASFFVGFRFD